MMQRIIFWGLMLPVVGACLVLGYWTQDRALPVESRFVDVVGPVRPGGPLLVRWVVNRKRACGATKQELVIDIGGVRWVLPTHFFPAPPGPMGPDTYISQTPIPAEVPTGAASLRVNLAYTCNPVQSIWPVQDTSIAPIPFDIVP